MLTLAFLVALIGCSRKEATAPAPVAAAASSQTFQGGPAAHPGDWCSSHGVPESACTRCNPELVPQFRARHDWCDEHGTPESQCTICHPALLRQGVAPTRPRAAPPGQSQSTSADAGIAPGTTVRLARPVVAERVGIETVAAEERSLAGEVSAPVRLDFDPTRLARVSSRVGGVVRAVPAALGATVRRGDPLVVLDSAAAADTRAGLVASRVRVANSEAAVRRAQTLLTEGVGRRADVELAETALAVARADAASLRALGGALGGGAGGGVRVLAPRAGVVVRCAVSVGEQVAADADLVDVADLSTLWALLDVPDAEASGLRVGLPVTLTIDGIAAPFAGTLAWLAPTVDPHTRTVQARVELPNPEGNLRANAFGRASIRVGAARTGVVIPRGALQRVRDQDVVFVARSPVVYEARVVEVALRTPTGVQVARGVAVGERVVTTGGFELKTELMRESIGAGCCDEG